VAAAAKRAARVVEWIAVARDLANAPPNELSPEALAERARELADRHPHLEFETLDRGGIERLGMGAFGAVAQGSDREPRLIVMRYEPADARGVLTLGLVGKAITFDTGGISLKPALAMEAMKGDMAGGAAVIAGIAAIAALELPVRVLAVVAATENMPGGNAFRPGDIVRAMNGKTIEIINTDAEGRLVLADALWYAREEGATHIVDFATLTGAMVLALGDFYAGLFANDDEWRDRLLAAAKASGDHLWPFPLHPRYRRYVDSTFADLKNASALKEGSPVLAAEFLREFAGEGPWAHVDMAGPGFLDRSRGDFLTEQGGTGYGVRLIVELAEQLTG
jgi:leucyl aminopeptidase